MPSRLQISNLRKPHQFQELKQLLNLERLYQQGTSPEHYLDFPERSQADLVAANLQAAGYQAKVL